MDFIYLFRVLLKRKWIIIGAAVVAALIAYLFTKDDKRQYRSIAQLSTGFTVNDEIKVGSDNFNFYEADTKFNNAIVTITSQTVLSLLSYNLILHDLQSPNPFRRLTPDELKSDVYRSVNKAQAIQVFQNKLETMSLLTSYNPDEKKLLEFLKLYGYDYNSLTKSLNVYRLERTDYIQIDFQSENPELSAFVVNNVIDDFLKYYTSIRSEKTHESVDTLRSLLEKKKEILDAKNAALQAAGAINGDIEAKSNFDLKKDLETQLSAKRDQLTQYTYSLQSVNNQLASMSSSASSSQNSSAAPTSNDDIVTLRNKMNDASTASLNNPSDKSLEDNYLQLKAQYQKKISTLGTSNTTNSIKPSDANKDNLIEKKSDLEADIQAANASIQSLENQIDQLEGTVISDAAKNASTQTLAKDVEFANKEYLDAKTAYNNATDVTSSSVNNFRQILTGQPAIDPEPSKKLMIVGMAGMSALIITMLIIIFLTYLDSSVKTPAIFAKTVNLKLLSMITFTDLKDKSLADVVTSPSYHDKDKSNRYHKHEKNRQNVFRESLRKLRYEIEKSGKKIFLFTSTKKGEGKTTLIQALSYSMSLSKKKILIIDTNFSNNDLTMQMHVESMLDKINANDVDGDLLKDIKSMATDIGAGTVYVIGCESGDYTPSEILPRKNFLQRLHQLTDEYDYIFLEGPPLNEYTDSKELAEYVDGVIAVFSATRNIKQMDKESIKFFKGLNGKFCGSVLNKVKLENLNSGS